MSARRTAKAAGSTSSTRPEELSGNTPQNWEAKLASAIEWMNERYFVVALGGRVVIASLVHDLDLGRHRLVFMRSQDLKLFYNHRHYVVGISKKNDEIWKDLGTAWIEDRRRRTYDRLALLPNGAPPEVYNLWRGFGVELQPGEWPRLRHHLLHVICAGDQVHFRYLVRWCAYGVQHPERLAEVAVVLRGEKGIGKGIFAQVLMRIFRDHALHVTNPRHLLGQFNAHLVDALFLFVDEAFWGGDKSGEGIFKGLITEPSIMIEPKGVDPFMMPNRLKILMASNNDWVVPATADERRYLVLDVSNKYQGKHKYFVRLAEALENGELAAFLDHLRTLDLSRFNIRAVPHTKALNNQKLIGADSVTHFWYDCLCEGAIIGTKDVSWPADVVTQVLHAAYLDHAHDHCGRHPVSDARMVERLDQLWAGCGVRRIRPNKPHEGIQRPQRYALGSLAQHREAFLRAMRIAEHSWPVIEEDTDAPG